MQSPKSKEDRTMAIKKTIKDGIVHTYSDAGLKIQRVDAKFPVNNAYEEVGKESCLPTRKLDDD